MPVSFMVNRYLHVTVESLEISTWIFDPSDMSEQCNEETLVIFFQKEEIQKEL